MFAGQILTSGIKVGIFRHKELKLFVSYIKQLLVYASQYLLALPFQSLICSDRHAHSANNWL